MSAKLFALLVLVGVVGACEAALGQEVIVYQPVQSALVAPPAVAYGPVVVQRPVVVQSPVVVPQPAVLSAPPVTVYRPVVPAPAVTVYSPVTSAPVVAAAPAYVVARPVVVRQKVIYVPGQPIRNVLRAVTP